MSDSKFTALTADEIVEIDGGTIDYRRLRMILFPSRTLYTSSGRSHTSSGSYSHSGGGSHW